MDLNLTQPLVLLVAGAAAFGIAALLWALRISDGARGAAKRFREQEQETRQKLARAESVFGAHPGVIMVWEDDEPSEEVEPGAAPQPKIQKSEWGLPSLYGSPVALMGLLRFADDGIGRSARPCGSSKAWPISKRATAPDRTQPFGKD